VARGVTQKQVEAQGGKFMTSQQFAQLSFDAKHVISF
jgi:hypothetical protein